MKENKKYAPRCLPNKEYESYINEFRLARGLSVGELSKKADVNVGLIAGLNNGTQAPIFLRPSNDGKIAVGDWKPQAVRIAKVLEVDVEVLFPRYACYADKKLTDDQILAMSMNTLLSRSAEDIAETRDLLSKFVEFVNIKLDNQGQKIFAGIILGKSEVEIAAELNISNQWVSKFLEGLMPALVNSWRIRESKRREKLSSFEITHLRMLEA